VFHVSQFKLCYGDHAQPYFPLPFSFNAQAPIIQLNTILQDRVILQSQKQVQQLLIQWEGFDEFEATLEDKEAFVRAYTSFKLEDKFVHYSFFKNYNTIFS